MSDRYESLIQAKYLDQTPMIDCCLNCRSLTGLVGWVGICDKHWGASVSQLGLCADYVRSRGED